MSTDFQKDLYKKSGSLMTVWDVCIGIGLITLGSGAYMHFKEKKQAKVIDANPEPLSMGMGSFNQEKPKPTKRMMKPRKQISAKKENVTKSKPEPKQEVSEESSDPLSKLGL